MTFVHAIGAPRPVQLYLVTCRRSPYRFLRAELPGQRLGPVGVQEQDATGSLVGSAEFIPP